MPREPKNRGFTMDELKTKYRHLGAELKAVEQGDGSAILHNLHRLMDQLIYWTEQANELMAQRRRNREKAEAEQAAKDAAAKKAEKAKKAREARVRKELQAQRELAAAETRPAVVEVNDGVQAEEPEERQKPEA